MGTLLHKLWDETVAGPAPENGLGKLRKHNSFSAVRSSPSISSDRTAADTPVTRSITVLKGGLRSLKMDSGPLPDSEAGSSNPGTPITPGTPDAETNAPSLTAYDWIVINALDR